MDLFDGEQPHRRRVEGVEQGDLLPIQRRHGQVHTAEPGRTGKPSSASTANNHSAAVTYSSAASRSGTNRASRPSKRCSRMTLREGGRRFGFQFAPAMPSTPKPGTRSFYYFEVFYHRKRPHGALGYTSPVEYENNPG